MGRIARVISSKVDDNSNIICTVEKSFGHNIQVPLYLSPGDNSFPLPDDRIFIVEEIGTGNYIGLGILTKNQGATKGETILYSRNSAGVKKISIHLQDDGTLKIDTDIDIDLNATGKITIDGITIELNGNTKKFVTYTELNTAITAFLILLNAEFAKKKDEAGNAGAITLDISAAETTTIKTGG